MTDEEYLEVIKFEFGNFREINEPRIKWLIKQVETLNKIRNEIDGDASMSYIFHKIEQALGE